MEILKIFNEDNVLQEEMEQLSRRSSTRAVMVDEKGEVGLIYSEQLNYYTLPGGGVEIGESPDHSVIRECKEETGYVVEIVSPLGKVVEVRKHHGKVSEVFGYLVKTVGEKGEAELMPDEIEERFVITWVSPARAKELFRADVERHKPEHKQVARRALVFLDTAFPND